MREFLRKYLRFIAILAAMGIGFLLIVIAVFMLSNYQNEILERAASKAQYSTILTRTSLQDTLVDYQNKATMVAANASSITDIEDLKSYLNSLKFDKEEGDEVYQVVDARFYLGDTVYESNGDEFKGVDVGQEQRLNYRNQPNYLGVIYDEGRNMQLIAFYAPVVNSTLTDGIMIFYTRKKLETFFSQDYKNENAEFTMLCTSDGTIVVGDNSVSTLITETDWSYGNVLNLLQNKVGEKAYIDILSTKLRSGQDTTLEVPIGTEEYIVSLGADKENLKDLVVVELYSVNKICEDSYNQVSACIVIIIIFTITSIGIILYLILHNDNIRKKIDDANQYNQKLGCFNRLGFEKEAQKYIQRNVNAAYSVIFLHLRHFYYLKEKSSESEMNSLLHYVKGVIEKSLVEEETFGHIEKGDFLLLIHSAEKESLIDRLKVISFLIAKYRGSAKLDILVRCGIYEVEVEEKLTVSSMIDYASEASNVAVKENLVNSQFTYNFYDSELRKVRKMNDDMELRMESALKNGEFQVFFQPKYNLNKNTQDGAEALVRWYDVNKEIYNSPGLFMPLFESNGFVIKLDKYVFERVCEYINYSIVQNRPVYPISVNVSRITAIQNNFVDYYAKIKNRYGIADGQIMIEFTESFAYENYDTLCKIVDDLHDNGFKCSIDDFGCGYSSFLTLKKLQMDEIKLDKIFLDKGVNRVRDDTIYKSIINLGKQLRMKVTQEGVETDEDLDYIKRNGCDVVQGYIYSRPISVSDYIKFVQTTKEHNLYKEADLKKQALIDKLENNNESSEKELNVQENTQTESKSVVEEETNNSEEQNN